MSYMDHFKKIEEINKKNEKIRQEKIKARIEAEEKGETLINLRTLNKDKFEKCIGVSNSDLNSINDYFGRCYNKGISPNIRDTFRATDINEYGTANTDNSYYKELFYNCVQQSSV